MGRRYTRVAALQKYLPVDSYGTCGDLACAKGTSQCQKTLMRYKFVLAFENGYCRDYITEKLWNAYSRQQIPVGPQQIMSPFLYYRIFKLLGL
nr:hypothetical protein BaRGS_008830 [Batillaria attramentaria]